MTTPRTLESFDKQDMITLLKRRLFYSDETIRELTYIERERKGDELLAQMDALQADMSLLRLPHDFEQYKALSTKWDRASKALDKLWARGRVSAKSGGNT